MKRRDLIKNSALFTGAVATPVALNAGMTKDEFQNAIKKREIDWNDHYTNYRFLLESFTIHDQIDRVPQRLFNEVMYYMYDVDDMFHLSNYYDENSYHHAQVSRLHHAREVATEKHQVLMNDYTMLYTLVAWEKDEMWDYVVTNNIDEEDDEFIQYMDENWFMIEVHRLRSHLEKIGLWDDYRRIFNPNDRGKTGYHEMDGFLEAWGLISYIEFRKNNGL